MQSNKYLTTFKMTNIAKCSSLLWQSLMLCGQMSRSQIRRRISEPPKSWLTVFWCLLFYWFVSLKILRCWFYQLSQSTHAVSSPANITSLSHLICSLSLSPLLALLLAIFYLSSFHIYTRQMWCCVIIDCNKLIELTTLFSLGIAHNIIMQK